MNDITATEFRERLKKLGIDMSKQRFHQGALPSMAKAGIARQVERGIWLISGEAVEEWLNHIVEFTKRYEGVKPGGAGKKRDLFEFVINK